MSTPGLPMSSPPPENPRKRHLDDDEDEDMDNGVPSSRQ
jgi:hypothetical protein